MPVLEQLGLDQANGLVSPSRAAWAIPASREAPELPFGLPEQSAVPAGRVAALTLLVVAVAVIAALL